MESRCPFAWASWDREDITLSRSCTKTRHSPITSVKPLLQPAILAHLIPFHSYSNARLLEINSHSLFSKWFSESGKLVQRLFTSITELVEEEDGFVVVLIGMHTLGPCMRLKYLTNVTDEVESLTAARAGAMAGTEPSDGLRVVNALLTQLDKLKQRKNVLIMATSNLVKAIGMHT